MFNFVILKKLVEKIFMEVIAIDLTIEIPNTELI